MNSVYFKLLSSVVVYFIVAVIQIVDNAFNNNNAFKTAVFLLTMVKQKHYIKLKLVFLETIYQNSLDETPNPTVINNKCGFELPVPRPLRSRYAIFLSLYVQHCYVPIIFCSLMLSFRGYNVGGSFM